MQPTLSLPREREDRDVDIGAGVVMLEAGLASRCRLRVGCAFRWRRGRTRSSCSSSCTARATRGSSRGHTLCANCRSLVGYHT